MYDYYFVCVEEHNTVTGRTFSVSKVFEIPKGMSPKEAYDKIVGEMVAMDILRGTDGRVHNITAFNRV